MMTALGSAVSPQACRQARIKRLSRRRHRPSRVQRANSVYSVPNGMSQSWPMARHCMPQNADAPDRHDRLAQRRSGQRRLRPGAGRPGAICRHGREFRQHRVDEGVDVSESIPRGRRSLGGFEGGAHMLLDPMAVGDGRRHSPPPSRASALIHLKVASRSAPAGTPRLRTDSQVQPVVDQPHAHGGAVRQRDVGPGYSQVAAHRITSNSRIRRLLFSSKYSTGFASSPSRWVWIAISGQPSDAKTATSCSCECDPTIAGTRAHGLPILKVTVGGSWRRDLSNRPAAIKCSQCTG